MKNKLTKMWLEEHGACIAGYEYALENLLGLDIKKTVEKLMSDNKFDWASWYVTKFFDKGQSVEYAIFAAEQVLNIYEKEYPEDDRPRKAIEAAKEYLKKPSAHAADNGLLGDNITSLRAAGAATSAADAAADAGELKTKIINFGLGLLDE